MAKAVMYEDHRDKYSYVGDLKLWVKVSCNLHRWQRCKTPDKYAMGELPKSAYHCYLTEREKLDVLQKEMELRKRNEDKNVRKTSGVTRRNENSASARIPV